MRSIGAAEAGETFAELLQQVSANKEKIVIEHQGQPQAVLVPADHLDPLDGWRVLAPLTETRPSEQRVEATTAELERTNSELRQEIAECKRAQTELLESLDLMRAVIDHSPAEIHVKDADGRFVLINRQLERLFGATSEEAKGKRSADFFPKELAEKFEATDRIVMDTGETYVQESDELQDDGLHTFLTIKFPIPRSDGGAAFIGGISTDITQRKRAEAVLKRAHDELEQRAEERTVELSAAYESLGTAEARLGDAIESISEAFILFDADERLVLCNSKYREMFSEISDLLVPGARLEDLLQAAAERGQMVEAIGRVEEWTRKRLDQYRTAQGSLEQQIANGRWVLASERKTLEGGIVGVRTEITERKRIEQELRENRERFQDFAEASADWFWEMNADLRFTYMSDTVERILGVAPEWHYGKTREELLGQTYDRGTWDEHLQTLRDRRPFRDFTYYRVGEGVEPKWLRASGIPVFAEGGTFLGYRGTGRDVTVEMKAEAELRESEARLSQAQKMEAVGQLTGGVAHDFNNLLAVIQGNAEFLYDMVGRDNELVQEVMRAATRGAELTHRLLAFSRKQALRPQSIGVETLVGGLSGLLRRTLGETIEIETFMAPGLWNATADPGQVENAILNLAINARDAMPDGGKLTIECANAGLDLDYVAQNPEAVAGDYVLVAVSDTGCGMSPEVMEHALEPFFTTKDVGEGTGLGLSMVYGFAKQSGGHVRLYSEEGRGTTVKLFLPRADVAADRAEKDDVDQLPRGRGEVVLVIEDEPNVRTLVVRVLDNLGYRVIDAPDARAALAVLEEGERIDLLLSDVVLPGAKSGPDFAREARERYPDLKVLFMSGYAVEAASRNGLMGSETVLLNKPFQRRELAMALRDALDR